MKYFDTRHEEFTPKIIVSVFTLQTWNTQVISVAHVSFYLSTVKVKTNWPTVLSAFKILNGLQTREKFNIVIRCLLFYFAIQLNFLASFLVNIGGYQLSQALQHKSV